MDTFHRLAIVGRGIKWMKMLIPLKKHQNLQMFGHKLIWVIFTHLKLWVAVARQTG